MSRPSLRTAINAYCRMCIHDPATPGNALQQVRACTAFNCPLWPVRPVGTAPWPAALNVDLQQTLGLTEAQVLHWREHPREVPDVPMDYRAGGKRAPYRFDLIISGREVGR